jgi:precorrin-2 dehydrogenase/sirohydrochlorin ferrochelatase
MKYYPVYLNIQGRTCLVVGGGQVGTRKVLTLLKCSAKVRVISPEATPRLAELAEQGRIELIRRNYCSQDLDQIFLVIGATDDQALNQQIHKDAETMQRLCNIADQPALCNFVLPSIVNYGDLSIAISTAGKSPAFAKHLRRQLEGQFGPEHGRMLELMGAVRARLLAQEHAPEEHKPLFEQLINSGLLQMVKAEDQQQIDALLCKVLGPGYQYDQLMEKR